MAEKKKTAKKEVEKTTIECKDRLCPKHGDRKLKMRGRVFQGDVIKVLPGRVTIEFERMLKLPKYERYEKRKTKIHARLPDCMKNDVGVGDLIEIAETRPISKMIHFVVSKVIRAKEARR
jgi:small subunit ribosomal protein S17|tara:strand:+ start:1064 stop:1423 length:360 start_codon:yes stop_codon:yes gene_type:complete